MFDKSRIKQDFNRAAEQYDYHASLQRRVADKLFSFVTNQDRQFDSFLDAGAGTGYFQELSRKCQHRWTIYQLDLAFNMCAVAQRYASLPEYGHTFTINGEVEQLPLSNNSVDGLFSSLMLQWIVDIRQAFEETYRILQPGGYGFFSTFTPNTLYELNASFKTQGFRSPTSLFRDEAYLTELLEKAGFNDIVTTPETIVTPYGSLFDLMRSLKGIGAQNKMTVKNNRFLSHKGLEAIETYYSQHYGDDIPATWEILYITARK